MGRDRYGIVDGELLRGLVRFGAPLSVGMGLHAVFNVVDMVVVGNLPEGAQALGVIALCDLLAMLATVVATGVCNAAVAMVARRIGEGDRDGAIRACWQSLTVLLAAAGVFALVALLFSGPIVTVMGAKGWVQGEADRYLQVIMGGSVTAFLLLHTTSVTRAAGHSYTPTLLLFGAYVLNLVLSVLLVYGPGEAPALFAWGPGLAEAMGIPRLGVEGAAWGTVIARGVVALPALLLLAGDFYTLKLSSFLPTRAELGRISGIAWPSVAQYGVRVLAILALLAVVAHLFTTEHDTSALSAMGVCIRLDTIGLFLGMGWGSAAATFVGQNMGAGQFGRATRAGWYAGAINAALLLAVGAAYMLFAEQVAGLFTPDADVIRVCRLYLLAVGPSYAFVGLAVALSTALAGAGDTMVSFRIDALVLFGLQTPLLLLLAGGLSLPLLSCFVVVGACNVVAAGLYVFAFSRGRWTGRRV